MSQDSETALLRYRQHGDEQAFATFVQQRTDLVWSVALRKLEGDRSLAEEVVQTVFADVVRLLPKLDLSESLTGWLVKHTLLKAAELSRRERRRKDRDHRYSVMNTNDEEAEAALPPAQAAEAAAVVDALLHSLPEADRQALLLRFYEKRELNEVAAKMGSSSEAVRKRIGRALDVVRNRLAKRGITSSATLLSTALMTGAVQAAPAGLAKKAAAYGLAHGTAAVGIGATLKIAAVNALKHSRWLPAVAGSAVTAVSAPLWYPPVASHFTPAAPAIVSSTPAVPPPVTTASTSGSSSSSPSHKVTRPTNRPEAQSIFGELSKLLDSPLGAMATDQTRRDFVARWKAVLGLSPEEEKNLDAWLAGELKDGLSMARQVMNDPAIARLAMDQAAGKDLTEEQKQQLIAALEPLAEQRAQEKTPWVEDHLDPDRLARAKARQQELRDSAADEKASAAAAALNRAVVLTEEQKAAVLEFERSLAASSEDLLQEEGIGFLPHPENLPAAPNDSEDDFLNRILDPAQRETLSNSMEWQQHGLPASLEKLRMKK